MKKTLIALATTATIALGTAGVASAAPQTGLDFAAGNGTAIEKVGYKFRYGYRYYGYRYYRYGYGYHYCKKLHYKGFVLGWGWARYKFYKYCAGRYSY